EKKPLYHFIPGSEAYSIATAGCNFTCLNCQNYHISQKSPDVPTAFYMSPEQVVKQCTAANCKTIAYTYTEPTVFYEYIYDIALLAKQKSIHNVLISNGYINPGPLKKIIPLLDAANIDLKAFDEKVYHNLNGGSLKPVLNTLRILKDNGVWIEITNLLIPSYSDSTEMIKRMCEWLVSNGFAEYPIHFSRFFPTFRLKHLYPTPVPLLKQAREIALQVGVKYVYLGNIAEADYNNTYCPVCRKLLIERFGYQVRQYHVTDQKCPNCLHPIAGVWK
ncbi:MAG: AmmeMemoRadiSam system radical SAM enzyme, partial [Bacteroidales bacterium]